MARLKVFAFDASALVGTSTGTLPASLRCQRDMLVGALLADLRALPGVELITLDADEGAVDGAVDRAAASAADRAAASAADSALLHSARYADATYSACMAAADAVWPLACESPSQIERVSRGILRARRVLLGSAPAALRAAASKLKMAQLLAAGGVPTVPTYRPHAPLPSGAGAWVVKPDDGSGCRDTRLFGDMAAALAWIYAHAADNYVLQPFVPGKLASLSLLCCDGVARILGCNEERVAVRDDQFYLLGSTVNGLDDHDGALARLAQQVATALPSLWGYVGVDVILAAQGAVVLDVNPRLTASYAGLHASLACNPAGLILDLLNGPSALSGLLIQRRPVSVDMAAFGLG